MYASLQGPSIVIADDDADAAEAAAAMLRLSGCVVHVAYDGHAALRQIIAHAPQVALLDLDMPALDGLTLARTLRARSDTCSVRLVALTGRDQATDRAATVAAGFDLHLVKPASAEQLQAAIGSAGSQGAEAVVDPE